MKPQDHFKSRTKVQLIETQSKDSEGKDVTLEWKVKPLSARLMVQNYKHFAALEKLDTEEGKELTRDQEIETLEKLSPLIEVVLPSCVIDPQIVMEGETNAKQMYIDDIDVETLMVLFTKIFEVSGLSSVQDKERQNLDQSPSPKQ